MPWKNQVTPNVLHIIVNPFINKRMRFASKRCTKNSDTKKQI